MTQKALADKLFVSAQAVSRWENGEVEPSLGTIKEMAKIFGISTDVLLGLAEPEQETEPAPPPEPEIVVKTEYVYKEQKPVLAVCEQCNRPIYVGGDIVRNTKYHYSGKSRTSTQHVLCKECDEKNKKQAHETAVERGLTLRRRSLVWGILGALAVLGIMIGVIAANQLPSLIPLAIVLPLAIFALISCCILQNNFIGDLFESIALWSFRMPGIIFSWDLDGFIWLITIKLTLAILGILASIAAFALAIAVSGTLSLFVYPFAIYKNVKHPEKNDD